MKSRTALRAHRSAIWLALLVAGGMSARAAVIDLRSEVRKAPDLIHHYTFEGRQQDLVAQRLVDRAGTADLGERSRNSTGYPLPYGTGYDTLSVAGTANDVSNSIASGRAWITTNAISLPSTMTVECVVRVNELPMGVSEGAIVTTRQASEQRGYYLWLMPDGRFTQRVGSTAARTVLQSVSTGHWYYVASTYTHNGSQTTINFYIADLTADTPLDHVIKNAVSSGTYGTSAVLGVGVLPNLNNELQYFFDGSIDEVAMYNTVHSFEAVSNRWEALRLETPALEYREIFPNDTGPERPVTQEGWVTHHGTTAISTPTVVTPFFNTAFDADIAPVASFPGDFGVTNGYLNNHSGPTNINYLYWTEEMTNRLDVSWFKLVSFDSRVEMDRILRLALRVDTNATPDTVGDDVWFVGADFDNPPGTSVIPIPAFVWRSYWVDVDDNEWTTLDFVPGSRNYLGETKAALPTNGLVTAVGLFQDYHQMTRNMRIDNFAVYARRIYPPPPPLGTVITLQ